MSARLDISQFVDLIAEKLPVQYEQRGVYKTKITGWELMLCGHKQWHGKPIEKYKWYSLDVPILRGHHEEVEIGNGEKRLQMMPRIVDHKTLLRRQWITKGLHGIFNYLKPYLQPDQLQDVKDYFMKAA